MGKLKAAEETVTRLFANYRKSGIEEAKAIAIVAASLSFEESVVAEILASHGLLGAGALPATLGEGVSGNTPIEDVDISQGLNALGRQTETTLGDGQIELRGILEDVPDMGERN